MVRSRVFCTKYQICIVFFFVLTFLSRSEQLKLSAESGSAITVPRPALRVEKFHVRSDVTYRFAITEVISEIHNYANVSKEARFDVRLPKTAFISNFTMVIDGEEYAGYVDEKARAREQYEIARKHGHSAGYVGAQPRNTDRFKVAVNVAANSTVTFKLIYEDLLQRRLGLYELVVYIDPGQIVPDMRVDVLIVENREITELNIPNIRNDLITDFEITDENPYAEVKSQSDKSVQISFAPSSSEQRRIAENGISGQFIVNYDVQREFKGGEILVSNGYFVHFFAPPDLVPMPKSIMFVLDVSGSMYRQKLKQLKDAMESILQDLNPEDDFNIVKFSSRVSMWKDKMVPVSDSLLEEAMGYTNGLVARGATNINDALLRTLSFTPFIKTLKVPMIFFLTDGNPTVGETDNDRLMTNVINNNKHYFKRKAAIFCLAFGGDADFDLVKSVASTNNGLARKIYTDADASLQLAGFYDEISSPVLSDVRIKYLDPALEAESITEVRSMTYFMGSEIIMSGRMVDGANENGTATIDLLITANDIDGSFVVDESVVPEVIDFNPATADRLLSITERMWAYLTIKQLLEDATYLDEQHRKANLTSEALELALKTKRRLSLTVYRWNVGLSYLPSDSSSKFSSNSLLLARKCAFPKTTTEYNFVTELTSMVVIKPSTDIREKNTTIVDRIDPVLPIPVPMPLGRSGHVPPLAPMGTGSNKVWHKQRKYHSPGANVPSASRVSMGHGYTGHAPRGHMGPHGHPSTPGSRGHGPFTVNTVGRSGGGGAMRNHQMKYSPRTISSTEAFGRPKSGAGKHFRKGGHHHRRPVSTNAPRTAARRHHHHRQTYTADWPTMLPANTSHPTKNMVTRFPPVAVVPVRGLNGWENMCIYRLKSRPGHVQLLSTKDFSLNGVLAPVIKEMHRGRSRYLPAFVEVTLNLSGSDIQITTSRVRIDNTILPWWRSAFINQSSFQANITAPKQLVVTTDDGLHLVVSRVGLRSRRSRSNPYLSLALLDAGSIDPKHTQGAFNPVMTGIVTGKQGGKPALYLNDGRSARRRHTRRISMSPASLPGGYSCWQISQSKERFVLVNNALSLGDGSKVRGQG